MIRPLLKNHPNPESIEWTVCDKETYMAVEDLLTRDVTFFEPFMVDQFYSDEDFAELKQICLSHNLKNLDYNQHLQKWEEEIELPQHLIDKAINKIKELVGTDDIQHGYYFYTHHQITKDGRKPRLPLHIDFSPGSYFIGLHIDSNRDWPCIFKDKIFTIKENQAIIAQTEFDYHWRPSWNSEDPNEYYAVLLFHLKHKNHWSIPNDDPSQNRDKELNDKFPNLGPDFVYSETHDNYKVQQRMIFDPIYIELHANSDLPAIPWDERPTPEDAAKEKRIKNIGVVE